MYFWKVVGIQVISMVFTYACGERCYNIFRAPSRIWLKGKFYTEDRLEVNVTIQVSVFREIINIERCDVARRYLTLYLDYKNVANNLSRIELIHSYKHEEFQ